ncbi:MAG: type IV pilin-like G/H family protein [Crinalium sp.]
MYKIQLSPIYLHSLNSKQNSTGFTLIELLVVIVISGILAAIALPSLMKQTVKAKQTAAKQNIALINHAQVIYRSENNSFANTFDSLLVDTLDGNSTDTYKGYNYLLSAGIDTTSITATPIDASLKGYSGGTNRYVDTSSYRQELVSIMCEANQPGKTAAVAPTFHNTTATPDCPSNYKDLTSK